MIRTFQKGRYVWSIERNKSKITITWGVEGGKQQSRKVQSPNESLCEHDFARLVREKRKAGYVETTVRPARPVLAPEGQALENALAENPDDLGAHMALADWLSEQIDPGLQARGEFIRLQLQQEQQKLDPASKRKLASRLKKLRQQHEAAWLGSELAHFFLEHRCDDLAILDHDDVERANWEYRRGWIDKLEIFDLTTTLADALTQAPALRLVSKLYLYDVSAEGDPLKKLCGSPWLANVRELDICEEVRFEGDLTQLVRQMPHLEKLTVMATDLRIGGLFRLTTLTHLRELRLCGVELSSLQSLAKNPALTNMEILHLIPVGMVEDDTHSVGVAPIPAEDAKALFKSRHLPKLRDLVLHRSNMGDEGVAQLVSSGMLGRLEHLDLSFGCITDEGARRLAAAPDYAHLKKLTLRDNRLTNAGIRVLRRKGLELDASWQQERDPDEGYSDDYLFTDDWE